MTTRQIFNYDMHKVLPTLSACPTRTGPIWKTQTQKRLLEHKKQQFHCIVCWRSIMGYNIVMFSFSKQAWTSYKQSVCNNISDIKLHLTLTNWHQVASLPLDSPGLAWPIYMYTNNATEILASAYPQLIRNIISTLANACKVK